MWLLSEHKWRFLRILRTDCRTYPAIYIFSIQRFWKTKSIQITSHIFHKCQWSQYCLSKEKEIKAMKHIYEKINVHGRTVNWHKLLKKVKILRFWEIFFLTTSTCTIIIIIDNLENRSLKKSNKYTNKQNMFQTKSCFILFKYSNIYKSF